MNESEVRYQSKTDLSSLGSYDGNVRTIIGGDNTRMAVYIREIPHVVEFLF